MVDEEDLRLVKVAAEREGRPEAELIRKAFHLVAMSTRTWDEPFFPDDLSFDFGGPIRDAEIKQAVSDAVNSKYEERISRRVAPGNAA